jgi:NADP-dependent 3-hydroxy acid dehydrogenase YdfG
MKSGLVVITGASTGIGQAVAEKYLAEGYPCLLLSRHIVRPKNCAYDNAIYQQVDVTDYRALESAIRDAEKKYGETVCLVNNAGVLNIGDFREMDIEKINQEVDVLVKGVLNGIRIVLPNMSDKKFGTIFNISSIGDRKPFPTAVSYHGAKHAVRSISESLQMAEAANNVRIMNIAPGIIKTNIHESMGISFEEYCEALGNPTFIESEELADIIFYCWKLPQKICIRDLVVMPTDCAF